MHTGYTSDVATARQLVQKEVSPTGESVIFAPDGRSLVVGTSLGRIQVFSVPTLDLRGEYLGSIPTGPETDVAFRTQSAHPGPVRGLRFTRDGGRLISVAGFPRQEAYTAELKVWNAHTGEELRVIRMSGYGFTSVDMSPVEDAVIVGTKQGVVMVWPFE